MRVYDIFCDIILDACGIIMYTCIKIFLRQDIIYMRIKYAARLHAFSIFRRVSRAFFDLDDLQNETSHSRTDRFLFFFFITTRDFFKYYYIPLFQVV